MRLSTRPQIICLFLSLFLSAITANMSHVLSCCLLLYISRSIYQNLSTHVKGTEADGEVKLCAEGGHVGGGSAVAIVVSSRVTERGRHGSTYSYWSEVTGGNALGYWGPMLGTVVL